MHAQLSGKADPLLQPLPPVVGKKQTLTGLFNYIKGMLAQHQQANQNHP